ncbi:chemotaxis protein, partial [Vibrio parahaemolyticus]|nr:chemotaxis protein [Vibrio parahaemolyticus]
MKFRHKVVTASSILLLITVSLLSTQQVMTIRSQTQEHINSSVKEILTSVSNTVQSEMNAKKDLARSITEIIELSPNDRTYVKDILEKPTPKSSFLAIGFG